MTRAIVLKHVDFEGPSRIATLLQERGCQIDLRSLEHGDPVPERLAPGELLIVMGGSMGVGDLKGERYPFLHREVALLRQCITEDAPVLGVCLGAQLLAHAAGAAVYPLRTNGTRRFEVGWAPIRLQQVNDPVCAGLPEELHVLHWHGDTFDLPARAQLLASSAACPNQAFRLGSRLFGVQFHCETSAEDVEKWLSTDDAFITRANGPGAAAAIRRDTARYMQEQYDVGGRLLSNMLDAMLARAARQDGAAR
ncbi:MAG: gamma-glutamyl-gamma-aminobutyrate hydrolase family protein [Polyangiaceae bacterium]